MRAPCRPGSVVRVGWLSSAPLHCSLASLSLPPVPQCLQENSDIKTYRPFVAVMVTLRKCKDQVCKTLAR